MISRLAKLRQFGGGNVEDFLNGEFRQNLQSIEDSINKASSGSVPVGGIILFSTTDLSPEYLYCDGSAVSRDLYPSLFAIIGEIYGKGDGITTFNLPLITPLAVTLNFVIKT
jgi:hypothetical protein